MKKKQFNSLLKSASEAANLIREYIEEEKTIHVASHYDADGLAAAGVIGKSLARSGGRFRLRVTRWLDENMIDGIATTEKTALTIFADFGSGDLNLLGEKMPNRRAIILDHHQPVGETPSGFIHVNPHLHGIDGSRDLSGAGVTYLVAKALDKANVDLACVATVGALGDRQDKYEQRGLGGVNETIVEDAVNSGLLKLENDLLFFGRETRPIHKALAYTTNPFIPGVSGEQDASYAFLVQRVGITPKSKDKWRALRDLSEEEKKRLFSALADHLASKGLPSDTALSLIGNVYTLTHEEPWTQLRDAREFAVLLNATGRMDRPSIGVAVCMGDRTTAFEQANIVLEEYRRTITKSLNWLNEKPSRIQELDSIYVVRGENVIHENIIGTVSSILSTSLPKHEKPIIAYSAVSGESLIKISARTLETLTSRGLNLGEILRIAAEKYSGKGGGHDIAAGAQVPVKKMKAFVELVNELVGKWLEENQLGG
ncbi:MAG: DHH family phosphoesterase [Candidatus Bathyarchaeota archaeon]|nr:MAG: DHH family phosphoesterase [Candidatus Bathyarchaeota archaeon]